MDPKDKAGAILIAVAIFLFILECCWIRLYNKSTHEKIQEDAFRRFFKKYPEATMKDAETAYAASQKIMYVVIWFHTVIIIILLSIALGLLLS